MSDHLLKLPAVSEEEENICLPLVISVISRYWNEEIPISEAKEIAKIYPKIRGTIMMEGIELAEKHGLRSYIYHGSLQDLQKRIDQGLPPIVILPGIRETVQHAMVISGYDNSTNRVLTYFPDPDKMGAIKYNQFNQLWKQDDNVTMIIVPTDVSEVVERDKLSFTQSNRSCFIAEKLHLQGNYEKALATLLLAKNTEPRNPRIWNQIGALYNERNNEEAEICYREAIELNSCFYLAFRGLGNYYLKKKDFARAEEYYSKAITINQFRFGPIYKNRAIVRIELGNKEGAATDFKIYLDQCKNVPDKKSVEEMIKELST